MQALRKRLRKLRFLVWFGLAFALFAYVVKPLRNAFWKPLDPDDACQKLRRGEKAFDRWGHELSYDARVGAARSAGPDGKFGTADDVTLGCME